jgi:hypothetical protein
MMKKILVLLIAFAMCELAFGNRPAGISGGNVPTPISIGLLEVRVVDPGLQCDNHTISPNPFELVVTVHNNSTTNTCDNVQVSITNGTGPGGTATIISDNPVVIPVLVPGATASVTFMADLINEWGGGCVNFTVTATSENCGATNGTQYCVTVPPCEPDCHFYACNKDMGDLPRCNYPTLWNNPGHEMTNVAWLGTNITRDSIPNILNNDGGDDGVIFRNPPWMPCEMETVLVTVHIGPEYRRFAHCGGHLYLSAWKDGNLDGDFCDVFECPGQNLPATEWIIKDEPITFTTTHTYMFTFLDPGQTSMGHYEGRLRFRLMSGPHGATGFGLTYPDSCQSATHFIPPPNCNGTFDLDSVGEVEDYIVRDLQLDVQLASFTAVSNGDQITLDWVTASETNNSRFEILRDGARLAAVATLGNDAAGHRYRYVDNTVTPNATYTYELMAVDETANARSLGTRTVTASPQQAGVITEYALHQNYPNPFNPVTNISFDLPEAGVVTLKVFNLVGQEVATLVHGTMPKGTSIVTFDASALPSALYFYRMEVNGFVMAKKMLLSK